MKKSFLTLLGMAGIMESISMSALEDIPQPQFTPNRTSNNNSRSKGYKQYAFDKDGDFSLKATQLNEIVFRCVAKSEKDALQKFKEFISTQQ